MDDAVAILREANTSRALVDEDGNPVELRLGPALDAADLATFERGLGFSVPPELSRLLDFTTTVDGVVELVDLSGRSLAGGFGLEEIIPTGIPIAHD